jgi:hypothetical protein
MISTGSSMLKKYDIMMTVSVLIIITYHLLDIERFLSEAKLPLRFPRAGALLLN